MEQELFNESQDGPRTIVIRMNIDSVTPELEELLARLNGGAAAGQPTVTERPADALDGIEADETTTIEDFFKRAGIKRHCIAATATAYYLRLHEQGVCEYGAKFRRGRPELIRDLARVYLSHPEWRGIVTFTSNVYQTGEWLLPPQLIGGVAMHLVTDLGHPIDLVERFFTEFNRGTDSEWPAIRSLHLRISRNRSDRVRRENKLSNIDVVRLVAMAWNLFVGGKRTYLPERDIWTDVQFK